MPDTCRRLTVDDLGALFALEQAAQPIGWTEDALLLELVHDDAVVIGRHVEEVLVAYCVARAIVDERWILNIATHPEHRRRGHADALLKAAAQMAHGTTHAPTTSLWLEVRASNHGAQALYMRHGFVVVGRRPAYYPALPDGDGEREAAILMRRPL
jgi:ribosomal-protein-alanine N-acetyltransferase